MEEAWVVVSQCKLLSTYMSYDEDGEEIIRRQHDGLLWIIVSISDSIRGSVNFDNVKLFTNQVL